LYHYIYLGIALINNNNNSAFPPSIVVTWYQSHVSSIDRHRQIVHASALGRAHVAVPSVGPLFQKSRPVIHTSINLDCWLSSITLICFFHFGCSIMTTDPKYNPFSILHMNPSRGILHMLWCSVYCTITKSHQHQSSSCVRNLSLEPNDADIDRASCKPLPVALAHRHVLHLSAFSVTTSWSTSSTSLPLSSMRADQRVLHPHQSKSSTTEVWVWGSLKTSIPTDQRAPPMKFEFEDRSETSFPVESEDLLDLLPSRVRWSLKTLLPSWVRGPLKTFFPIEFEDIQNPIF